MWSYSTQILKNKNKNRDLANFQKFQENIAYFDENFRLANVKTQ
jgi:hypothetical protein